MMIANGWMDGWWKGGRRRKEEIKDAGGGVIKKKGTRDHHRNIRELGRNRSKIETRTEKKKGNQKREGRLRRLVTPSLSGPSPLPI